MKEETKYQVYALFEQQFSPAAIAEKLDESPGGVMRVCREYAAAKVAGTLDQIMDVDRFVVQQVGASMGLGEETKALTAKMDAYDALRADLQTTAAQINTKLRSFIMSAEHASELSMLTETLCQLQTAFVNKQMTQVNVQNNYGGEQAAAYSSFLGDAPDA